MLIPEHLSELLARSGRGEGVRAVLAEWGLDNDDVLEWLKQHHAALKAAKAEYRRRQMEPADAEASRRLAEMAANVEASRAD